MNLVTKIKNYFNLLCILYIFIITSFLANNAISNENIIINADEILILDNENKIKASGNIKIKTPEFDSTSDNSIYKKELDKQLSKNQSRSFSDNSRDFSSPEHQTAYTNLALKLGHISAKPAIATLDTLVKPSTLAFIPYLNETFEVVTEKEEDEDVTSSNSTTSLLNIMETQKVGFFFNFHRS